MPLRALAALLLLAALAGCSAEAARAGDGVPAADIADLVVAVLEERGDQYDGEPMVCAAEAIGYAPADAVSIDETATLYAHVQCASLDPVPEGIGAARFGCVVAVDRAAREVHYPPDAGGYSDWVRETVPDELVDDAWQAKDSAALTAEVDAKYAAVHPTP